MGLATFLGIVFCLWIVLSPICKRIDNLANLFDRRLKKLEDIIFRKKKSCSDD